MTKDELSTISTIVEQLQEINSTVSELSDIYLSQAGQLQVAYWKLDKIVKDNSSGEQEHANTNRGASRWAGCYNYRRNSSPALRMAGVGEEHD